MITWRRRLGRRRETPLETSLLANAAHGFASILGRDYRQYRAKKLRGVSGNDFVAFAFQKAGGYFRHLGIRAHDLFDARIFVAKKFKHRRWCVVARVRKFQ
jgi:hypothetical protein